MLKINFSYYVHYFEAKFESIIVLKDASCKVKAFLLQVYQKVEYIICNYFISLKNESLNTIKDLKNYI